MWECKKTNKNKKAKGCHLQIGVIISTFKWPVKDSRMQTQGYTHTYIICVGLHSVRLWFRWYVYPFVNTHTKREIHTHTQMVLLNRPSANHTNTHNIHSWREHEDVGMSVKEFVYIFQSKWEHIYIHICLCIYACVWKESLYPLNIKVQHIFVCDR